MQKGGVIPRETAFERAAHPHVAKASLRQRRAMRGWHSRYCASIGGLFAAIHTIKRAKASSAQPFPPRPLPPPPLSPCALQPSKNEEDDALRCGDPTALLRRSYCLGHNRWLACVSLFLFLLLESTYCCSVFTAFSLFDLLVTSHSLCYKNLSCSSNLFVFFFFTSFPSLSACSDFQEGATWPINKSHPLPRT